MMIIIIIITMTKKNNSINMTYCDRAAITEGKYDNRTKTHMPDLFSSAEISREDYSQNIIHI
jgi:hypothetical protein